MTTPASRSGRRYGALAAAVTVGMASIALPISPAQAAEATVADATFSWAVNEESGGGAYFGGANWLVAGEVGDVHGERERGSSVWDAQDEKHFTASSGNTTITRPDADGNQIPSTWAEKNNDANGNRLTPTAGSSSWNQANISSGTGTVDADGNSAEIQWDGSFTLVYYGGMTYWTVNDPKLVVEDGVGTVTATLTGYGADMNDLTKWVKLDPKPDAEIATLTDVEVTEDGIQVTPEYAGVEIEVEPDGPSGPQNRDRDGWGSFPQDWVDFNVGTGQAAYWYSSGGMADPKKTAAPITIEYTADEAQAEFSGTTDHSVVAASEEDGLGVEIEGTDYENLPKPTAGDTATGVYSAIIDREKSNEFDSSGVLGATYNRFADASQPNSFSQISTVEVDKLDEDAEYDAVVWTAHGNGTDETVVYREPIELTEEQRDALFPEEEPTEEPSEEPTEEPTEDPTEDPTEEPSEEPTEEPSEDPSEEPTEEPSEEPTDDATEEPSEEPTEEPSEDPSEEPTEEPSEEPTEEPTDDATDDATEEPTDDATDDATDDPSDEPGDDEEGVRLVLSADTVGISDFLDSETGVTLAVEGLEQGDSVDFQVDPISGQNVEPAVLSAEAGEDGVASTIVYGTSTTGGDNYLGDYEVTVDADDVDTANAGQDSAETQAEAAAADDLTATFSVVADDDAPGDDGNGGGDNGGDNGNGGGDNGSDDGKSLPRTGATLTGLFAGIGAIVVGAGALFASRRRNS